MVFGWLFWERLKTFVWCDWTPNYVSCVDSSKVYVTSLSFLAVAFCLAKWNFSPPHTWFRDHPRCLLWFKFMFGILTTLGLSSFWDFSSLFLVFVIVSLCLTSWEVTFEEKLKVELTQYKDQISFTFYFLFVTLKCSRIVYSSFFWEFIIVINVRINKSFFFYH